VAFGIFAYFGRCFCVIMIGFFLQALVPAGNLAPTWSCAVILNLTGIKFYERFSTSTGSRRNARLVK